MKIYENVDDLFLDGEIFKDIDGYNGDYQVSNFGRIKSFKKWHGKDIIILSQCRDSDGYLFVNLCRNGIEKTKKIHTLMFETFNNCKLKKSDCIHHIDQNPLNNILNNFQLMTNSEHLSLHIFGSKRPGEKSGHHVLTEQDVIEIWKYLDEGVLTQKEIGKIFGVSQLTISNIKTGKTWKHINRENINANI